MAQAPLDYAPSHIFHNSPSTSMSSADVVAGLKAALSPGQAKTFGPDEPGLKKGIIIFNGAVKSPALALVQPRNARDVSRVVRYCTEHGLELSVKGGGFGTHGWSVAGHVVVDLSLMDEVSIALPSEGQSLFDTFEATADGASMPVDGHAGPPAADGEASNRPPMAPRTGSEGVKRGVPDEFDGDACAEGSRGRRRTNMQPDGDVEMENPEIPRPESGSGSSADAGQSGESSNTEGRGSRGMTESTPATTTGSESRSGSGSAHGTPSASTAPPVISDGVFTIPYPTHSDVNNWRMRSANGFEGSSSGSSGAPAIAAPTGSPPANVRPSESSNPTTQAAYRSRTTYVNPSPTVANPAPLDLYGSSSAFYSSRMFAKKSDEVLVLNTNPDPPAYTIVTFGAGANSKALDNVTGSSKHGAFHVPSSAFPVGSGQFLAGGFGFLGRRYGLAMDNIIEAELVLADGRIVWVGENGIHHGEWKDGEDPEEIWWAVRGAGATIGVITRFRAKAYYVPSVYAGNFIYIFHPEITASLLRHVRDCIKGSPRTLYVNIILTAGPPGLPAICVIQVCHSGSQAEGNMFVSALGSWTGSPLIFQDFSERTFGSQQLAVEMVLKGGHGRKWFIKSDMLNSLSDEVIDETCNRFDFAPDGCTWLFEFTGGSVMGDVQNSCFPQSHRRANFTVAALHQWNHDESPEADERCIQTANKWINEVIHPHSPGGPLPCFLQSSLRDDVAATYGTNFTRLERLKRVIDPSNFFKHAMWPRSFETAVDGEVDGMPDGEVDGMAGGQADGMPDGIPDGETLAAAPLGERRPGKGDNEPGPDQWRQVGADDIEGPTVAQLADGYLEDTLEQARE